MIVDRVQTSAASLLGQATQAWTGGDGDAAMTLFQQAADAAEQENDQQAWVSAVLGLARGQQYNLSPGLLPVRLQVQQQRNDTKIRVEIQQ